MKKRNVMILVILLVIGFASVSTSLILNGTIGIGANKDDFDVIFTEATINGEGATATIDETKKKITFTSSKLTTLGEKAILDYKVKNNSTQYDADVTINCTNDTSEYIKVTNTLADEEITENYKTTFTAQEEKSGTITAELIKSATQDTDSVAVTCTIVASATEKDSAVEPSKSYSWEITEDNDNDGKVSKDDLITLGTESFYVYNTDGDTIKAISQYNLEVGNSSNSSYPADEETNIQSPRALGYKDGATIYATLKFASASQHGEKENSYTGSIVEEYVNNYVNILKEKYDVEVTGRLITKEELEALGCDLSNKTCLSAPSYIYSTSYWTSSPNDENDFFNVCHVRSFGEFYSSTSRTDGVLGVRPVIEISKSLFE